MTTRDHLTRVIRFTFSLRQPPEGVVRGQRFVADVVLRIDNDETDAEADSDGYYHRIPTGHWRDGLCDCFAHGKFHPILCVAVCCLPVAIGQVMTRVGLSAAGNEMPPEEEEDTGGGRPRAPSACRVMACATVLYCAVVVALTSLWLPHQITIHPAAVDAGVPAWLFFARGTNLVVTLAFVVYQVVVLTRTRAHVRRLYGIPERYCGCAGGLEDCCCSCWLPCCTVLQVARHTADYSRYPASYLSETGLFPRPRHPPYAVV
jgi:Cys-rich protein (TIGR01571 family)